MIAKKRIQAMFEQMKRAIRVFARLHSDTHERRILLSASKHLLHQADAQLFRDVEPHGGELHGDVCLQSLRMDAIEDFEIRVTRATRLALISDALTEQIEGRANTETIHCANRLKGLVARAAADVTGPTTL